MQFRRAFRGLSECLLFVAAFFSSSLIVCGQTPREAAASQIASDSAKEPLQSNIAKLIEQLGDENFQTRRAAELALVRIGLPAFEQLRQAMNHPDVQVEVAARYLVRSQSVTWWLDTDPISVRQVLQDYNELKNEQRETAMQQLSREKNDNALLALCRITRYESSEKLSKSAALYLLETFADRIDSKVSANLTPHIREAMGDSERPAAQWIETLVDTIDEGSLNVERWRMLAQIEYMLLEKNPRETSKALVMRLHRVIAAQCIKHSKRQLALDIVRPCLDLVENKSMQVRGTAIWAIDAGLPELVNELSERHAELFAAEPLLGFLNAESYLASGDHQRANATAELASDNIARFSIELNRISKEDIAAMQRFEVADVLRRRGMYNWAQIEYEKALDIRTAKAEPTKELPQPSQAEDRPSLPPSTETRIRFALAELFAEGEDYTQAAQTLGDYIAKVQENPSEKDRLTKNNSGSDAQNDLQFLLGNFNYYSGKAAFKNKELPAANDFYTQALQHYPENPDILIAMKSAIEPGVNDQQFKKNLAERIAAYHEAIATLERDVISSDRLMRQNKEYELAGQCNQLAWLLASTSERPLEAVQLSLRSLELIPGYGIYQDTLARCYFAAGEIDKAISMQELAVKNEPFQRSMLRQLEEFKAAKK